MRRLVYLIACTVDGRIARRDGSTDFIGFEGPHVADLLREFPEMSPGTFVSRSASQRRISVSTRC